MKRDEELGNRVMRDLRAQLTVKDDGRYLIYYSLPAADSAEAADVTAGGPPAHEPSDQQPWSPDRQPDV